MNYNRVLKFGTLVLFIVAFPFLSWYYLKQGFNYRKQALEELSEKTPLNAFGNLNEWIKGQTALISFTSDGLLNAKLYDQFKDAPSFVMVVDSTNNLPDTFNVVKWDLIQSANSPFDKMDFVLVDTQGLIRHRYLRGEDYTVDLVKHIATLLPVVQKRTEKK